MAVCIIAFWKKTPRTDAKEIVMLKSLILTTTMLAGVCAIGAALADDFDGEKPAVQTADRLEWAWDGGDRLGVAVPGTVHYSQGGAPRVIVRGPADLLKRVRYDHGELELEHSLFNWDSGNEKLDITVTGTTLRKVGIAGSADVQMGEVHQDRLALSIAGSGSFEGSGKVDDLSLHIAGSGNVHLGKMTSGKLEAHISGNGNLETGASGDLDAEISGSGGLETGAADHARISISGSGDVHFAAAMPQDISVHVSGSGTVTDSNGRIIGGRYEAGRQRDSRTR
jgi:hypothetical protein